MRERVFPGALLAAALGLGTSGPPFSDFAQHVPARCLPEKLKIGAFHDGCSGAITFGMRGPMVVPGRTPDIEVTGSTASGLGSDAEEGGSPE